MSNVLEMTNFTVAQSEIWDLGLPVEHIWDTYDLVIFKVFWGIIRCTCVKMACNSKMVDPRAKLN